MVNCYKFKKLNLVFCYNAKCACTTIKNIINQIDNLYQLDNYQAVHHRKFTNTDIEKIMTIYQNCYIIFFIRNPYDRAISGYSKIGHKIRFDRRKTLIKCRELVNNGDISIINWIKLITTIPPKYLEGHFGPQTHKIKHLLRHRNIKLYDINYLDNFEKYINKLLNIKLSLNIHPEYKRIRPELDNDTKKLVYNYFMIDFNSFGYNE